MTIYTHLFSVLFFHSCTGYCPIAKKAVTASDLKLCWLSVIAIDRTAASIVDWSAVKWAPQGRVFSLCFHRSSSFTAEFHAAFRSFPLARSTQTRHMAVIVTNNVAIRPFGDKILRLYAHLTRFASTIYCATQCLFDNTHVIDHVTHHFGLEHLKKFCAVLATRFRSLLINHLHLNNKNHTVESKYSKDLNVIVVSYFESCSSSSLTTLVISCRYRDCRIDTW